MPDLFLSPSTQEYNLYYDGSGSEEYYMNRIADAMEPYLVASGITVTGQTGDWYSITYGGISGYVYGEYLAFS